MTRYDERWNDDASLESFEDDDAVLDVQLAKWHAESRAAAEAGRNVLLSRLEDDHAKTRSDAAMVVPQGVPGAHGRAPRAHLLRHLLTSPAFRAAACLAIVATVAVIFIATPQQRARAAQLTYVANGGELSALDQRGRLIGPCPLRHTAVDIEVSGPFSRITVTQQYHNPYQQKIEAVYTFPLSHRAAVDRMRMIIDGERIIEGEVRERDEARMIYEQAKAANQVAALLEQERPNIFTQSVANIEPGASIDIEISYIETVERIDGVYSLAFPMTVAPRYIPGYADGGAAAAKRDALKRLPPGLTWREGVILIAPAVEHRIVEITETDEDPHGLHGLIDIAQGRRCDAIERLLEQAIPIQPPPPGWAPPADQRTAETRSPAFSVLYSGAAAEFGQLSPSGVGELAGRWFYYDPTLLKTVLLAREEGALDAQEVVAAQRSAAGFAQDTDQVPDASRITPMPAHPSKRAGHDISLRVRIDAGGPTITSIESELHEIESRSTDLALAGEQLGSSAVVELRNEGEIPNRDFVLHWSVDDSSIAESTFVHAGDDFDERGGFFTLLLAPPARVEPEPLRPRELIFVMDISGSMKGDPLAKSQALLTRAIDSMREGDTFNIITFADGADVLWDAPRSSTDANRAEALAFINSRAGDGGTEIMNAIKLALEPTSRDREGAVRDHHARSDELPFLTGATLMEIPADGREVSMVVRGDRFRRGGAPNDFVNTWDRISYGDNGIINIRGPFDFQTLDEERSWILTGRWITEEDGGKWLDVTAIAVANDDRRSAEHRAPSQPMRFAVFLTDGEVGNDMAVIDAVKANARSTRVFCFGVGNSVNRYLLANMAHAGRGEVEFITQEGDRDAAVERFAKRLDAPVLSDIELSFSDGLEVSDIMPLSPGGLVPDVYDNRPIIIHGRYSKPGSGALTITGRTGAGEYRREIALDLSDDAPGHDVIRTLWARQKIDAFTNTDLTGVQLGTLSAQQRQEIVDLAIEFDLLSQFTSFIAVEKSRVTIDGEPVLVTVPIELPSDADWSGFFSESGAVRPDVVDRVVEDVYHNTRISDWSRLGELIDAPLDNLRDVAVRRSLEHVRELQLQRKYDEALRVLEQIEFIDEDNVIALALRDAALTAQLWDGFLTDERLREFSYSNQFQTNREATTGTTFADDDLQQRIEALESQVRVIQEQEASQPWLTEARAGEVRQLVRDVWADAYGRADGAAVDRSPIQPRGGIQARYMLELGAAAGETNATVDSLRSGFENTRVRLNTGPAPRSTTGSMNYPDDWPQLGTLRDPSIQRNDVLYFTGAAGESAADSYGIVDPSLNSDLANINTTDARLLGDLPKIGRALNDADADHAHDSFGRWRHMANPRSDDLDWETLGELSTTTPSRLLPHGDPASNFFDGQAVETAGSEPPTKAPEAPAPLDQLAATIRALASWFDLQTAAAARDEAAAQNDASVASSPEPNTALALRLIINPAEPGNAAFYVERVILLINDLLQRGHSQEAATLAGWLMAFVSGDEEGDDAGRAQSIHTLLVDNSLSDSERRRRMKAHAESARELISTAISESLLQQRIAARVSEELLSIVRAAGAHEASGAPQAARIRISVLVDSTDDSAQRRLREAGLEIEAASRPASLIIGTIDPRELRDLALCSGVRRVERTRLE